MTTSLVHWTKLAQIEELKEYFEQDFQGFRNLIEEYMNEILAFSQEDLDKLAQLRVLEVTNGCVQWSFRKNNPHRLSIEQTRQCMNTLMRFMKEKTIYFPSQGTITFNPDFKDFMEKTQKLYQDAFKNNVPGKERIFHASSTAQFIACGRTRLEAAMNLVQQDYEELFSAYFLQRGRHYITMYIECINLIAMNEVS